MADQQIGKRTGGQNTSLVDRETNWQYLIT